MVILAPEISGALQPKGGCMRRYETVVILNPDISGEDRGSFFEKIKDMIPRQGGFLFRIEEWGIQKLAYEIRKKTRGHYSRIDYCGTGLLVSEMERFFRIDDRPLKYLTVLLEEQADIESLKQQMAQAEAAAAAEAAKPSEEAKVSQEVPVKTEEISPEPSDLSDPEEPAATEEEED
jgi:small subunit ribosomal protein S6